MVTQPPLTPDEIERLLADLDAGAYDEELAASRGLPPETAQALVLKFAELTPFDVKAWAERRGIKLPET